MLLGTAPAYIASATEAAPSTSGVSQRVRLLVGTFARTRMRLQTPGQLQAPKDDPDLRRQVIFPTRKMTLSSQSFDRNLQQASSSLLAIRTSNANAQAAISAIEKLAEAPHGAPALGSVARGLERSISQALDLVGETDARPIELLAQLRQLAAELEVTMSRTGEIEPQSGVEGIKTRLPGWWTLAQCAHPTPARALTYVGLRALVAWHQGVPLAGTVADRFTHILRAGDDPSALPQDCHNDLERAHREVVRLFCPGPTPPEGPGTRVTAQLLDGVLAATPRRRAGARNHRELSRGQLEEAFAHIGQGLEHDSFAGALGALVCITGFTPEVVAGISLGSARPAPGEAAWLDPAAGILYLDHAVLLREAATARPGCRASGTVCAKPLPWKLAALLQQRHQARPQASCIAALFPEDPLPQSAAPVYLSKDMISPSWARLRNAVGTYLREQGMDNLMASIVCGRLWHIPQSKLFYATAQVAEIQQAFARFYRAAGWGEAAQLPLWMPGFGCQAVPTLDAVVEQDRALQQACEAAHPGQHSHVARLLEHHNRYMRLTGFRLSLLLALRETQAVGITADMHEDRDRWIAVHDKDVHGRDYPLPMPLARFTGETLAMLRAHIRALRGRLIPLGEGTSELARWCLQVSQHQPAAWLMVCQTPASLRPLATRDFVSDTLAPDWGRKFMENALRNEGLKATEVDAFLRHVTEGQAFQSSIGHQHSMATWHRTTQAVDRIARQCFGQVATGLSRE